MGCATLINTVALATPTYTMANFQIPKDLCEEMDALIRKFWWNPKNSSSHYFTPMALDHLCHPKNQGALGFMHLHDFNQALLSKAVWRFLVDKDGLVFKLLKPNIEWAGIGLGRPSNKSFLGSVILQELYGSLVIGVLD